jgi:RimJ/RimL family protein N-acetyltransferase
MKKQTITISSELILEPFNISYDEVLFGLIQKNEEEIIRTCALVDTIKTIEDMRSYISREFRNPNRIGYVIRYRGKVIGETGIRKYPDASEDSYSSHIWIDKDYQRKGLGAQILKARIDYIFKELKAQTYIVSVKDFNKPCRDNLISAGFKFSSTYNSIVYGLLYYYRMERSKYDRLCRIEARSKAYG